MCHSVGYAGNRTRGGRQRGFLCQGGVEGARFFCFLSLSVKDRRLKTPSTEYGWRLADSDWQLAAIH